MYVSQKLPFSGGFRGTVQGVANIGCVIKLGDQQHLGHPVTRLRCMVDICTVIQAISPPYQSTIKTSNMVLVLQ